MAALWDDSLASSVIHVANTNARFTGIKVKLSEVSILAISLYLPTAGKDEEFIECLAELSSYISDNSTDKLGWKCHTRDLSRACQPKNDGWDQT